MKETLEPHYLGIDVGTGSARAGIFDYSGKMAGSATRDIRIWKPQQDFVEQSSNDIWSACCEVVKSALQQAGLPPDRIAGIGFDATCSLVALDGADQPVTVSPDGADEQNVIVWMDHRALEQTKRINADSFKVLSYVGGSISVEMQAPKLLWLKEHLPESWQRTVRFMDLPDYLVYRATGEDVRSLCSTVCKWTYLGHEKSERKDSVGRWDDSFWQGIGLGEFVEENYKRIGQTVRPMGEPVGQGLSQKSAEELGLVPGTPVGVSIIDAHAGGLGMLGGKQDEQNDRKDQAGKDADFFDTRLALIGGTSSCHMAVSQEPRFVPGVWGPYCSAMIPGLWLTEGGQSATGALIDHVIFSHARALDLKREAEEKDRTVYALLNERLDELVRQRGVSFPAALTSQLHVLPYFHGNRSPRADPSLTGMISGLKLSDTLDDLALLYLAAIQAVAHGTRHIIDSLNDKGYRIDTIFACGGGTKNPVFLREHADVTGCRVVLPREPEAVLLGSAVLGAAASGDYDSVQQAMAAMNHVGETILPSGGESAAFHEAKHRVFQRMFEDHMHYRELMS